MNNSVKNLFVKKINRYDTVYGKNFNKDVYFISNEFYRKIYSKVYGKISDDKEVLNKDKIEQTINLFDGTIYKLVQKWNGIIVELSPNGEKWNLTKYIYWENERWANKFLDELVSIAIMKKLNE